MNFDPQPQIEPSSEVPIYFDYNMWSLTNAEGVKNGEPPRYRK